MNTLPPFSLLSQKAEASAIYRSIKMGKPREWDLYIKDNGDSDRRMIISTSPIHDGYSCITGVLGIAMDITRQGTLPSVSGHKDISQEDIRGTAVSDSRGYSQSIL